MRQGTIDNPPKPPVIPGFECSGIVESVAENTAGLEVNEMQSLSGAENVFRENQKLMQGAARLIFRHPFVINYSNNHISLFHISVPVANQLPALSSPSR